MPTPILAAVAAVAVTLQAAHAIADHWVQTDRQARDKGEPGWSGRRACLAHVTTYTLTAALFLSVLAWRTAYHPHPLAAALGLTVSASTHYFADRRVPLRRLADLVGTGGFYRINSHGTNGSYLLDQSFHQFWLFVSALIITA